MNGTTAMALSGNNRIGTAGGGGGDAGGSLAVFDRIQDPMAAVEKLGDWFFKSGLFGLTSPAQGSVVAMACLCERKNPMEIARRYHVIEGRLSMKSEAMLAEFNERGGKHRIIERTGDAAEVELTPPSGQSVTFRFSWQEAALESFPYRNGKDGELKNNWKTPRGRMQMLWARVVSDGVRAVMPGVVIGTYTPEEIGDIGPAMVATAAPAAVTAGGQDVRAARRAELEAMNRETAADVPPVECSTPATSQPPADDVIDAEAEVMPAAVCTNAQLQRLADLGAECGMSIPELKTHVCKAAGVDNPAQMTETQAAELIRRLEETVEKKRSTSA